MRCRVFVENGRLKIYPPAIEYVEPLLNQLGQKMKYESIPHPTAYIPLFQKARKAFIGISMEQAKSMTLEQLWQIHNSSNSYNHGIALLDLKIEICKRRYLQCELCGNRCGVDRFKQYGKCNLGAEAFGECWGSLIGEEAVLNPSAGIAMYGCPWDCSFCHASDYLNVDKGKQTCRELSSSIWKDINYNNCQSIMFNVAGDPAPNVLAILKALRDAPEHARHPVIWNGNSYATSILWKLIDGIFDAYAVDLKFGNDKCANELAGCQNHNKCAMETLLSLSHSLGKVIIRWLLLPGHIDCCGLEIVKMLSQYDFYVSLIDDFMPDYKMIPNRKNTEQEIRRAKDMIKSYRLKDINNPENVRHFWDE